MLPSREQFGKVMNEKFKKLNGQEIPDAWLSWTYEAFRMGYFKGQDDFAKSHDWYE